MKVGWFVQETGYNSIIEKGVRSVLCNDFEVDLEGKKRRGMNISLGFLSLDEKNERHVVNDCIDCHDG